MIRGLSKDNANRLDGVTFVLWENLQGKKRNQDAERLHLLGLSNLCSRVTCAVRIPDPNKPNQKYWMGNEGFVFRLDVMAWDGDALIEEKSGEFLLKIFSENAILTDKEGLNRLSRIEYLCAPGTNLHELGGVLPPAERDLFAGAPVFCFRHHLLSGLPVDEEHLCYVMRHAGWGRGNYTRQWTTMRMERILTVPERISLATMLAKSVFFLERAHITHCDLSPDNLLIVSPENAEEGLKLCVIDFDQFRCEQVPPAPGQTHRPGHMHYRPPPHLLEQIAKAGVGYDRFALGLLILEILLWMDPSWNWETLVEEDDMPQLSDFPDGRSLYGPLRHVLTENVQNLMDRLFCGNIEAWPSPTDWMDLLRSETLYRICLNPARCHGSNEQGMQICGWPLPHAFAAYLRSLLKEDRAYAMARYKMTCRSSWSRFEPYSILEHTLWLRDTEVEGNRLDDVLEPWLKHNPRFCPVCGTAIRS